MLPVENRSVPEEVCCYSKAGHETPLHPTHCLSGTSQDGLNAHLSISTTCWLLQHKAAVPQRSLRHNALFPMPSRSAPAISPQGHSQAPQLQPLKLQCRTCCLGLHQPVKLIIFCLFFIAHSKTEMSRLFVYLEGCIQSLCPGEHFGSCFSYKTEKFYLFLFLTVY